MAIVEGLIQIAGKLEMRVIAEGIESEEQVRELISAGCLFGQGYLFSEAVDRTATTALLLGDNQTPACTLGNGGGSAYSTAWKMSR